jgi:hypothetical protein
MKALRLIFVVLLATSCSQEDAKVKSRLVQIAQYEDMGVIGPERELVSLLYHSDFKVREQAVWALGRIQDATTLSDLSTAATLDTLPLKSAVAWAMGQLASEFESEIPSQALSALFTDTSTQTRQNVVDALSHLSGEENEQFLQIFGLLDGNPSTRGAAALAVGRTGQTSEIRDLAGLLRDQEPEVRWRAARAFLHDSVATVVAALVDQEAITSAQRIDLRMAGTHTIREAAAVLDLAYTVAGSTAIYQTHPLQRRFQDMHVITQHMQARLGHYGFVGKYFLGHPFQPGPMN